MKHLLGIDHLLQISTLSLWLSITCAGMVGVMVRPWHLSENEMSTAMDKVEITTSEFVLEAPLGSESENSDSEPSEALLSEPEANELPPSPPELAPLAELDPLPEIPQLALKPAAAEAPRANRENQTARSDSASKKTSDSNSGIAGGTSVGSESSPGAASRISSGRMPAPKYPISSKRNKETGTIIVEFTIGTDGRVISAYAKSSSPWPALNEAAVCTVRTWKFPPGGVLKIQRPITFQLR